MTQKLSLKQKVQPVQKVENAQTEARTAVVVFQSAPTFRKGTQVQVDNVEGGLPGYPIKSFSPKVGERWLVEKLPHKHGSCFWLKPIQKQ